MSTVEFVRSSRELPGPRDWILDLFGSFVRDFSGWIGVADLLSLLASLGVNEASGRSALSRMKRQGELESATSDGVRGYALTASAERWFADGTPRIVVGPRSTDDDLWVIAAFSVPEVDRNVRYRIRTRLQALGFGQLSGGLMIAPSSILDEAVRALERAELTDHVEMWEARHVGFSSIDQMVSEGWDLPRIEAAYGNYLELASSLDELESPATDEHAFIRYLSNINAWRELPFMDPSIPLQYLPPDWPSAHARATFTRIAADLRPGATRHFVSVVGTPGDDGSR